MKVEVLLWLFLDAHLTLILIILCLRLQYLREVCNIELNQFIVYYFFSFVFLFALTTFLFLPLTSSQLFFIANLF
jgi:hypothetical protein